MLTLTALCPSSLHKMIALTYRTRRHINAGHALLHTAKIFIFLPNVVVKVVYEVLVTFKHPRRRGIPGGQRLHIVLHRIRQILVNGMTLIFYGSIRLFKTFNSNSTYNYFTLPDYHFATISMCLSLS